MMAAEMIKNASIAVRVILSIEMIEMKGALSPILTVPVFSAFSKMGLANSWISSPDPMDLNC